MKRFILIIGGARSGKSGLAQKLAREADGPVLFVATAQAGDEEMRARIAAHQLNRPPEWRTVEEPLAVADAIERGAGDAAAILLDCITLWASNLLLKTEDAEDQLMGQIGAIHDWYRGHEAALIVVTDEVGMGLVPEYPSGRAFRDLLGRANQRLAQVATEVYLMVAGIPIELKGIAARPWRQDEPYDKL